MQLTVNGVLVLLNNQDSQWLEAAVVDYHNDRFRKGFTVQSGSGGSCC